MSKESKIKKNKFLNNAKESVDQKSYLFVFNYQGLSAGDFFALRKDLFQKTGDKISVMKNSISKIVMNDKGVNSINGDILKGQNAIIFTSSPVSVSSILEDCLKKQKISSVFYTDKLSLSDQEDLKSLSKFKNEDGLKSALLMLLKEPCARLVRVLNQKCDC